MPNALRILLIDDDALLLKAISDTLEADGHLISTVEGGQAGIDAFQAAQTCDEAFHVVITDLGMPGVDGRTVAASVKRLAPATPVILLTGWGNRISQSSPLPEHVDRVIGKPPKLRELRDVLALYAHPSPT